MNDAKRISTEQVETDTAGLWAMIRDVEQRIPPDATEDVMRATLKILREAAAEGHIIIGQIVDQGEDRAAFPPWPLSVDAAMVRIQREWVFLGRSPEPGEIA